MHGLLRVGVGEVFQNLAHANFHAEFLAQFAREASLKGFAGFAFAAGKFPQPAQVRSGVAFSGLGCNSGVRNAHVQPKTRPGAQEKIPPIRKFLLAIALGENILTT